ncbi:hypothetical protein KP79_PYT26132 [Mizuhopecten yessoensis]|uniref:Uncharacterized protein n=1 Tax=Mizuhopecten yessoensis TaxID=6573 RepID=A0A210QHA2_MIZYE|nr:hypothetical protein KP79_PYT26132 [Mizuhopecten yessoensis]
MKTLHNQHLPEFVAKIKEESNERVKLELWGRKWNLVIKGLPGSSAETPKETEVKFRTFLKTELKLSGEHVDSILLQAIHRLPSGDIHSRNFIVRFMSLIDRDMVMKSAMGNLKAGCGKAVMTDLTPELSKLRGALLKKRREMAPSLKAKTKLVYLKDAPFLELVPRK